MEPEKTLSDDGDGGLLGRILPMAFGLAVAGALAWWLVGQPDKETVTHVSSPPPAEAAPTPSAATVTEAAFDDSVPEDPLEEPAGRPPPTSHPGASVGTPQTGHLEGGRNLAEAVEPTLRILAATTRRGFVWGTGELIELLIDTAKAAAAAHPGSRFAVGNLSRSGGGDIPPSVSHNSGRDADLAFFLRDAAGKPARARHYVRFDDRGVATSPASLAGRLHFDTARNWTIVRQLLSHPAVVVQWIFVSAPLRNMLLDHALRIGEPKLMQARATRVLVQPRDSSPHNDHFHVRIACPPDDRPRCIDGGGRTALARQAQVDALLEMYHRGTPAERRYARDMLSLPRGGDDLLLPPAGDGDNPDEQEAAP